MQKRKKPAKVRPLEGIRVLAVEQHIAIPIFTMIFADWGAETIRIEQPGAGDPARLPANGYFTRWNRNKKSLALDLQKEGGREILKELVKVSDIFAENMRDGLMDELGLGYDVLKGINPQLIYVANSGYGRSPGPLKGRVAYDIGIQARSGMLSVIGEEDGPPLFPKIGFCDLGAPWITAVATLMALEARHKTGRGQYIDQAMYDSMVAMFAERLPVLYSMAGIIDGRGPEKLYVPWGCYPTKDGYVGLVIIGDVRMWERLCKTIGRQDLFEPYKTDQARVQNRELIRSAIIDWMKDKTSEEVADTLTKNRVPCEPVQTAEDIMNCPQLKARNMLVEITDCNTGKKMVMPNSPIRLSDAPLPTIAPAPLLGEHTEEILSTILGYGKDEIERLKVDGVIGISEKKS